MRRVLNRSPLVAHFAVVGLLVTTIATFGWALAKTVRLVIDLVDGRWEDDLLLVDLLDVIDTYLIAIVQLIVVIGLYELFVGDLDVPDWLEVSSLDDLKKSLVDVLIVVLAVKGIEKLVAAKQPLDALYYSAAVAVLVGTLSLFRSLKSPRALPGASRPVPALHEESSP